MLGGFGSDPGACLSQLVDAIGDVVLPEIGQVGPEGIGLDGIDPHGEVGVMNASHHVRPRDVEDLIATLVPLEVSHRRVGRLEHGAHRAVGNQDTLGKSLTKEVRAAAQCCGPSH